MKVDFSVVMTAIDGKPINQFDLTEETLRRFAEYPADKTLGDLRAELQAYSKVMQQKPLTLGKVACEALLGQFKDEANLSGEAKMSRFKLAEIALREKDSDMKAEEIAEIKKLIAKMYSTVVVGRAFEAIEQSGAAT